MCLIEFGAVVVLTGALQKQRADGRIMQKEGMVYRYGLVIGEKQGEMLVS